MADYKVVQYVNEKDEELSQSSSKRSCYSFCMCPGGQVQKCLTVLLLRTIMA